MAKSIATGAPLNFRVRAGLVVHRRRIKEINEPGRKGKEVRVEQFGEAFGSPEIELLPDEVKTYAHALEPLDEASAAALQALHYRPPVRAEETTYEAKIATMVATATVEALAALGFLKAPKLAK